MKLERDKFYKTRSGRKAQAVYVAGDGVVIRLDSGASVSLYANGLKHLNETPNRYDLIAPWQEPLDFDWDCLPKWADKWTALYDDGFWYCFAAEPLRGCVDWGGPEMVEIPSCCAPKNYTGAWQDSLHKNPKYAGDQ